MGAQVDMWKKPETVDMVVTLDKEEYEILKALAKHWGHGEVMVINSMVKAGFTEILKGLEEDGEFLDV